MTNDKYNFYLFETDELNPVIFSTLKEAKNFVYATLRKAYKNNQFIIRVFKEELIVIGEEIDDGISTPIFDEKKILVAEIDIRNIVIEKTKLATEEEIITAIQAIDESECEIEIKDAILEKQEKKMIEKINKKWGVNLINKDGSKTTFKI